MQKVEEEYKVWNSMKSELEIIERFSAPSNTLFLCVLWKILLDTEQIPAVAYQVLLLLLWSTNSTIFTSYVN